MTRLTLHITNKRANLCCMGSFRDLPVDKYAQWREIEITFNPENMRPR